MRLVFLLVCLALYVSHLAFARKAPQRHHALTTANAIDPGLQGPACLELFSPAKVNLFIRITGRRPDGYHELASLFQAVSLGDTLAVCLLPPGAPADLLECDDPSIPCDASNLVLRALDLWRRRTTLPGPQRFFRVRLQKRVPHQAGLGGGSSNAATALWAARALLGAPSSMEEMASWAAELGADVAFFLSCGTAYCTGRGEVLQPLPPLEALRGVPVFIFKPQEGLPTPAVYRALQLPADQSDSKPLALLDALSRSVEPMAASWQPSPLVNDLEGPAFRLVPRLAQLKQRLADVWGEGRVAMSGSGSALFAVGSPRDPAALQELLRREPRLGVWRTSATNRPSDQWYPPPIAGQLNELPRGASPTAALEAVE